MSRQTVAFPHELNITSLLGMVSKCKHVQTSRLTARVGWLGLKVGGHLALRRHSSDEAVVNSSSFSFLACTTMSA